MKVLFWLRITASEPSTGSLGMKLFLRSNFTTRPFTVAKPPCSPIRLNDDGSEIGMRATLISPGLLVSFRMWSMRHARTFV